VQAAQQLGVDRKTLSAQAARLGCLLPKPGSKSTTTIPEQMPQLQRSVQQEKIKDHRESWLRVYQQNPGMTRTELQKQYPAAYGYLRLHDPEWLETHMPQPLNSRRRRLYTSSSVDWSNRDVIFAESVRAAAQRLKEAPGRPISITRTAIMRNIENATLTPSNLEKLPLTKMALSELAETSEQYAVRRVHWAADDFRQNGVRPTRSQLVERAQVRYKLESPLIREALDTAMKL
jgi:hypothetical protein